MSEPEFGVSELANLCGTHRETQNNRLKTYGLTGSTLVAQLKLVEAEKLLAKDKRSVGETALKLGYSDPTAFSRGFSQMDRHVADQPHLSSPV
ncbi:helix-turn-helix domain-containing protein [Falsihalocynthiibacter sp. SS001]|uniref:helix-turn-helix domain-containing protein n=1 Tax=Falsihalocynthiibacter sp. SS001 TaxID=3349698 RepID=UPI0036D3B9F8